MRRNIREQSRALAQGESGRREGGGETGERFRAAT
jgi:hypothetical protein